jgi:hypothetical protein
VWPDGAVHEELEEVGPEHVPVVIVILLTVFTAHDEATNPAMGQQSLVYGEVGQVFLHSESLVGVEWLARFDRIESCGRVGGVAGKGVRGQTGRFPVPDRVRINSWESLRSVIRLSVDFLVNPSVLFWLVLQLPLHLNN